jgi:hypothetical protein
LTIGSVKLQYRDVDFDIRGICALFKNGATFLLRCFGIINNSEYCILGEFTGLGHALKIQETSQVGVLLRFRELLSGNLNR